jgi:release factor glutamine methyltransferase
LTVAEALASGRIDGREARLLLAEATGFSEASVIAFPEKTLPPDAERTFADFVERRGRGEPVAYILGRKEFYGLRLAVNPAVLIPRPETELLVELALERPFDSVADLGTGSGAIALALKHERGKAQVVGVEADSAALAVAKSNAARLGLDVDLRHGRWFEPLLGERYDLIVSNPPYVAEGDPHLPELIFEPKNSLLAGRDGLDALREIASGARVHLAARGWLLVEHGVGQDAAVRALFARAGLEEVRTWPDLAGIPRVTGGRA